MMEQGEGGLEQLKNPNEQNDGVTTAQEKSTLSSGYVRMFSSSDIMTEKPKCTRTVYNIYHSSGPCSGGCGGGGGGDEKKEEEMDKETKEEK